MTIIMQTFSLSMETVIWMQLGNKAQRSSNSFSSSQCFSKHAGPFPDCGGPAMSNTKRKMGIQIRSWLNSSQRSECLLTDSGWVLISFMVPGSRRQRGRLQQSSSELCERQVASPCGDFSALNHGAALILPVIGAVGSHCSPCYPPHPSERTVPRDPSETCWPVRGAVCCGSGKRQPDPGPAASPSAHHRKPKDTCPNTRVQYVEPQPWGCWKAISLLGFTEDCWDLLCSWGAILSP